MRNVETIYRNYDRCDTFFFFIFRLRDIKVTYNHIKNVQSRAETILKDLSKKEVLTDEIRQEVVAAKSLDELDTLVSVISERTGCYE